MRAGNVPDLSKEHKTTVRGGRHSAVCSAAVWKSHVSSLEEELEVKEAAVHGVILCHFGRPVPFAYLKL